MTKQTKIFFLEAVERAQNGEACLFNLELLPLKNEERKVLNELGLRLGRGTDQEQTALILRALARLEESRKKNQEKLIKVTPLWRWLSPLTALLVVLLTC